MPVNVQSLDYEPLGFLSWGLREDGELVEQRAFGPDTPSKDTYAVYTLENEALRADFTYPWVIVGAIRPTSAMELGPTGFRCGDAEIVALARSPLWRDDEKRAAERTAERYGVPLVEFDRLAAVASEHGTPVPEDDRLPLEPEPQAGPRLRGGPRSREEDRPPPEPEPRPERDHPLNGAEPAGRPVSAAPPPRDSTEAVAGEPGAPSRAPQEPPSVPYADLTPRRSIWPVSFKPWRRGLSDWLAYWAVGAALIALAVGIWLLARAGWPSGSLPFQIGRAHV